jgi:hypothetical protein
MKQVTVKVLAWLKRTYKNKIRRLKSLSEVKIDVCNIISLTNVQTLDDTGIHEKNSKVTKFYA